MTEIPDIIGWLGWAILFLLESAAVVLILCGTITLVSLFWRDIVQEVLDDLRMRKRLSK